MIYSRPDLERKRKQEDEEDDEDFEFVEKNLLLDESKHSWYKDFLYTCTKNVRNATMLAYIDPDFAYKLGMFAFACTYNYSLLDEYVTGLKAYAEKYIYSDITECVNSAEFHQFRKPEIDVDDQYFQNGRFISIIC
jgi:hypothetical protein